MQDINYKHTREKGARLSARIVVIRMANVYRIRDVSIVTANGESDGSWSWKKMPAFGLSGRYTDKFGSKEYAEAYANKLRALGDKKINTATLYDRGIVYVVVHDKYLDSAQFKRDYYQEKQQNSK